jgi:hypothetical protein
MKNRTSKSTSNSAKKYSWRILIGVGAITILIVGVVSAISRQSELPVLKAEKKTDMTTKTGGDKAVKEGLRNYVTSNSAGQTVVVDRQTGQQRPLTPDEARTLAEGIKQLVNQSTEGLVQVRQANGAVSMDLQGRFQNVLLAKKEADGTVTQSCVDNVDSAAAFFEIDPALFGSTSGEKGQPVSTTPAVR